MANPGFGNRLEVVGNLTAFSMTNDDISPSPSEEFFTHWVK